MAKTDKKDDIQALINKRLAQSFADRPKPSEAPAPAPAAAPAPVCSSVGCLDARRGGSSSKRRVEESALPRRRASTLGGAS